MPVPALAPVPGDRTALPLALAVLALAALVAALVLTVTRGGTLRHHDALYGWYAADLALFAGALAAVRRVGRRRAAVWLVLLGSAAVAATGLFAPPRTSDDAYRYVWDGRVQAAGISPYTYAPDAPRLAALRAASPDLFPPTGACTSWDERRTAAGQCTHINRPEVHTIYPPVAEGWFLAVHAVSPRSPGAGLRGVQTGGALLAVGVTAVLLADRRRGGRPWRAALWGWFPGTALWCVNDGHVDVLGVLLMVSALTLAGNTRWRRAGEGARDGALLGLGVATKLLPVLALPGLLSGTLADLPRLRAPRRGLTRGQRHGVVAAVALVGAVALAYLPYVLVSGTGVLGFLPDYLQQEGYDESDVQRFGLLRLVLPAGWAPAAAVLVLAAVGLWVLRRGDPERPWAGALAVTGTALLVADPGYPWYSLLVVALAAFEGRWEWLGVPVAGVLCYFAGGQAQQPAYGGALALVVVVAGVRLLLRRRGVADARRPAVPEAPGVPAGAAVRLP